MHYFQVRPRLPTLTRGLKSWQEPNAVERGDMAFLNDLTGKRFSRLLVIKRDKIIKGQKPKWICQCDCGEIRSVFSNCLVKGTTRSCGCLLREISRARRQFEKPVNEMTEYRSWQAMKKRVNNPSHPAYQKYGGRGIIIDDKWNESFNDFYNDMGPKPSPEYSIERIDNNGNYCKENCKWGTKEEQSANRSTSLFYVVDGEKITLSKIARKYGINYKRLYWYVKNGLSLEEAIRKVRDTPSRVRNK